MDHTATYSYQPDPHDISHTPPPAPHPATHKYVTAYIKETLKLINQTIGPECHIFHSQTPNS
jgi:hypothetical protein